MSVRACHGTGGVATLEGVDVAVCTIEKVCNHSCCEIVDASLLWISIQLVSTVSVSCRRTPYGIDWLRRRELRISAVWWWTRYARPGLIFFGSTVLLAY